jgi:hypothetical protein
MATPAIIQAINFSADSPSAPANCTPIVFQNDGGAPLCNVSAFCVLMEGDSGSGGYSGAVPPPQAGDAAAGKFLKADGSWAVPASSGFTSGNNGNGYWVKDPTGHIHQWGVVTTDINSGTLSVSFPTSFTTAASISVVVSTKSSTDRITYVVDGSVSTSGFTVGNNGSSGYAYWIADGY